jgi:endonuclease/exonuclease/phosphatase family metal-dependent hydrolase
MGQALKIMTWNVQMLPPLFTDSVSIAIRVNKITQAIRNLPLRDKPDIIAFNEVFLEEGRDKLIESLKRDGYDYQTIKFEHIGVDVEQDSGLLLVSKLPFIGFKDYYKIYKDSNDTDSWAAKGVGFVQIARHFDPVTIALTHLQASYNDDNTDNMDIRSKQFDTIREELLYITKGDIVNYNNSIVIGDLNVKGDPDDNSGEWNQVFGGLTTAFGKDFNDQWRESMHAPNDLADYDFGYTQQDTETNKLNRFDYICTNREIDKSKFGMLAHHISTPIHLSGDIADHWAVLAHIHKIGPHCTPSAALDLFKIHPILPNSGQINSYPWTLRVDFIEEDMYYWIYVSELGTYSIWTNNQIEYTVYERSDFTNAKQAKDKLHRAEVPYLTANFPEDLKKGAVFSAREPFFIRLRGNKRNFKGDNIPYGIIKHKGETAATAIILEPHLNIDLNLPYMQPLGLEDKCYCKAYRPNTFTEVAYDDKFVLSNSQNADVKLSLLDSSEVFVNQSSGNDSSIELIRNGTEELVYIVIKRANQTDTKFEIKWVSPISYLIMDSQLKLQVEDEAGWDIWGSDEYELEVWVDNIHIYSDSWDDADTNELWPDLVNKISAVVAAKFTSKTTWISFVTSIDFELRKTDGIWARGTTGGSIRPLTPYDKNKELRTDLIVLKYATGDAQLKVYGNVQKFT